MIGGTSCTQVYYSQFVNNNSGGSGAGINPALMVEICGPSLRISALFTAGLLSWCVCAVRLGTRLLRPGMHVTDEYLYSRGWAMTA
jgi:hypothetical protein